ncbi:hypothetical protein DFH06DRAFT_1350215 [Mycena polygramma]|nr:hypothetical protein DFH06DRAFT_1350215 [Mycena polygramma]
MIDAPSISNITVNVPSSSAAVRKAHLLSQRDSETQSMLLGAHSVLEILGGDHHGASMGTSSDTLRYRCPAAVRNLRTFGATTGLLLDAPADPVLAFFASASPGAPWASVAATGLRPRHHRLVLPILDVPGLLLLGQTTHDERRAIDIETHGNNLPLRCLYTSAAAPRHRRRRHHARASR